MIFHSKYREINQTNQTMMFEIFFTNKRMMFYVCFVLLKMKSYFQIQFQRKFLKHEKHLVKNTQTSQSLPSYWSYYFNYLSFFAVTSFTNQCLERKLHKKNLLMLVHANSTSLRMKQNRTRLENRTLKKITDVKRNTELKGLFCGSVVLNQLS